MAALCGLLDEIRREWPGSVGLSGLASVLQQLAQSSPRFHTVACVAEWPWPLSGAAGAKAGSTLPADAPCLQSKEDLFTRGLAWRFLGLTVDVRGVRESPSPRVVFLREGV